MVEITFVAELSFAATITVIGILFSVLILFMRIRHGW